MMDNQYQRDRYWLLRKNGLCVNCKKENPGAPYCDPCRKMATDHQVKQRNKRRLEKKIFRKEFYLDFLGMFQ